MTEYLRSKRYRNKATYELTSRINDKTSTTLYD